MICWRFGLLHPVCDPLCLFSKQLCVVPCLCMLGVWWCICTATTMLTCTCTELALTVGTEARTTFSFVLVILEKVSKHTCHINLAVPTLKSSMGWWASMPGKLCIHGREAASKLCMFCIPPAAPLQLPVLLLPAAAAAATGGWLV